MKDNFAYKYFLLINHLANKMNNHIYLNFALLIYEEDNGKYMNSQMTFFFYRADELFSDILANNSEWFWDELDIEEIAKIPPSQLESDYNKLILNCEEDNRFVVFNY